MCGREKCMFLSSVNSIKLNSLDHTPPSVFIGRANYPEVYAGPLLSDLSNPEILDAPWMWQGSIEDIVNMRLRLARGIKKINVSNLNERYILELQDIAASMKHIDVEAKIEKIIKNPKIDKILKPVGFTAKINNFKVVDNPKIPNKVEKLYNDELKATDAVYLLFKKRFMSYYIQRVFSAGMLGNKESRKIVPTRWSITAVHDIIGEKIKEELDLYNEISEFLLYTYEHFGNKFAIIISPGKYFFRLIEIWCKEKIKSEKPWIGTDSENIKKKRKYSSLSGGYYATRLPVLEYLWKIKKQGNINVIREVTPDYTYPLGVWVVEEGVRRALKNKPIKAENKNELINLSSKFIKTPKTFWRNLIVEQTTLEKFI